MLLVLASTWTFTGIGLPWLGWSVQLRARLRYFQSSSAAVLGSGALSPVGSEAMRGDAGLAAGRFSAVRGSGDLTEAGSELSLPTVKRGCAALGTRVAHT